MKTGNAFLDRGQTSGFDLPLFRKLGLPPFDIPTHQEHFVGEVKLDRGASVKIWVQALPSKFWTCEVRSVEGVVTKMETGSGRLSDFWPSVMLIADGMMVLKSGEPAHA